MFRRKKTIEAKQVAFIYMENYMERRDEILGTLEMILVKQFGEDKKRQIFLSRQAMNYVEAWIIAFDIMPLFSLPIFKGKRVDGWILRLASEYLQVEKDWLFDLVKDFIVDINFDNDDRTKARSQGLFSRKINQLVFNVKGDPLFMTQLDMFITENTTHEWKLIEEHYKIIPTNE
ncbi:MAG: hypothetical protein ABIQ04_01640 [Candidatus Saccharimonadales bacterium]